MLRLRMPSWSEALETGAEYTAEFSALSLVLTIPSITATKKAEYASSFTPLSLILEIPLITATRVSEFTSSFTPVSLIFVIPEMTASFNREYSSEFTPLSLLLEIPSMVATYEIPRTYIVFENDRLEIWVKGVNVARFNSDGSIDVKDVVNESAY